MLIGYPHIIHYDKKATHIPFEIETLIVQGDNGKPRYETISHLRTVKHMNEGCQAFMVYVTEDKSTEKRLEDVSIIRDFSEVISE